MAQVSLRKVSPVSQSSSLLCGFCCKRLMSSRRRRQDVLCEVLIKRDAVQ